MRATILCLAFISASCGALGWIAQDSPRGDGSSSAAHAVGSAVSEHPAPACRCLDQPPPPAPEAHTPPGGPSGAGAAATIDTVTGIAGIVTGNPLAWGLIGQLAHLGAGLFRRKKTA